MLDQHITAELSMLLEQHRHIGLDLFRKKLKLLVTANGWGSIFHTGDRDMFAQVSRDIFIDYGSLAHAAERLDQLKSSGFGFWVYRCGCEDKWLSHKHLDGIALPGDHPFWALFVPPNAAGCHCYLVGAHSLKGVHRVGGDPFKTLPPEWDRVEPETGLPLGMQVGFCGEPKLDVEAIIMRALTQVA